MRQSVRERWESFNLLKAKVLRVKKAFGVKMDTLLRMQARYDAFQMRLREADIPVRRFTAV